MIAAPGADALAAPRPNTMNANRIPRPGPGLASNRNRTDLPVASAWVVPSGVSTPWLMALLRKSTLAGSMKIEVSGSRSCPTRKSTPWPAPRVKADTTGPTPKNPMTAITRPAMPAEKLFTSISKPGRILPSHNASSFLMTQPPNGPMIIAPMNIGTSDPATTPMVVMAPTTAPRVP